MSQLAEEILRLILGKSVEIGRTKDPIVSRRDFGASEIISEEKER